MARGGVTPNVTWTYRGVTVHPANGDRMPGGLRFRWWATTPRGEMLRAQTRPEMREMITERGGAAALKAQREEYRVWRRTPAGVTRKYITRMSLPGAQAVIDQLRADGDKSQLGVERVVITEESYEIEWQELQ
jgi:hypothetical protein